MKIRLKETSGALIRRGGFLLKHGFLIWDPGDKDNVYLWI